MHGVGSNQHSLARNFGSQQEASGVGAQDRIRRNSLERYCRKGEVIFREGDRAEFVCFVESGVIRVSRCMEGGNRQILAFRVSGDLFGITNTNTYLNSAEAVSDARIHRLSWQLLCQMMRDDPQLLDMTLSKMLAYFRETQTHLMILGQHNMYQRLASVLLDFLHVPEFFDAARRRLILPVSHCDIAEYLAAPPQSTSRAFGKLESAGFIRRIDSRTIEIPDVDSLELMKKGPRRNCSESKTGSRAPRGFTASEPR